MLLFFLGLISTIGQAQKIQVKGKVQDKKKIPILGATVVIKGAKVGTQSDSNGHFTIEVLKGDKLQVFYLGYKAVEQKITDKADIDIVLSQESISCFAPISQRLPFNIHEIDGESMFTQQDIYNAIRTKVPGVRISNTQLGKIPKITMRDDSNTIVIIDGVRYADTSILNTLNPSDIEKIYVANNPAAEQYLLTKRN